MKALAEARADILKLEDAIRALGGTHECQIKHFFAPGVYARAMFIPADTLVTGKIHLTEHLSIMAKGHMSVSNEGDSVDFVAGDVILSKPGAKRAGYAHEDSVWITIHATELTEPEEIEAEITVDTFEQFDNLLEREELKRIK